MDGVVEKSLGPDANHAQRVQASTLKLLHDFVLVQPLAPPLKKAGSVMFMPENAGERERNSRGIVLAVGPGDFNQLGTELLPMTLEPGDLVFFGKYAGTEEEFDGRKVLVMRETEIRLAVSAGRFLPVEHDDARLNHLVEDWCDVCYGDPEAEAKARLEEQRELRRDEVSPLRSVLVVDETGPFGGNELGLVVARLDKDRPRRACLGADGQPCLMMQVLDGKRWVGRSCGHEHSASLEP